LASHANILIAMTHIGNIIRRQRELRRLSVRSFAELAGISNPYLSQIERGLRAPSDRVIEAMARSLDMTAEDLHALAGGAPLEDPAPSAVEAAIEDDPALTPRSRRVLLDVYYALVQAGPLPAQRAHRPPATDL
jgi:transcriptional regulator with XRE-family HTH domain